jgi:hypothetical protein
LPKKSISLDERLLKFGDQWSNPIKHVRDDIPNDEIIELYNKGLRPYKIAKVLKDRLKQCGTSEKKEEIKVSYHTIISRIKKLSENGII